MNDENNDKRKSDEEAVIADNYPLATRMSRLIAFIIDELITSFIIAPFYLLDPEFLERFENEGRFSIEDQYTMVIAQIVLYIVLNSYLFKRYGQSIGKRMMGIAIVSFKNGQLLSLSKIINYRYLPIWLIGIASLYSIELGIIGVMLHFISMLDKIYIFRPERRTLHDYIAGTKVINVKRA